MVGVRATARLPTHGRRAISVAARVAADRALRASAPDAAGWRASRRRDADGGGGRRAASARSVPRARTRIASIFGGVTTTRSRSRAVFARGAKTATICVFCAGFGQLRHRSCEIGTCLPSRPSRRRSRAAAGFAPCAGENEGRGMAVFACGAKTATDCVFGAGFGRFRHVACGSGALSPVRSHGLELDAERGHVQAAGRVGRNPLGVARRRPRRSTLRGGPPVGGRCTASTSCGSSPPGPRGPRARRRAAPGRGARSRGRTPRRCGR